ncbi:MAG: hypothetical protein HY815_29865 [Candidatus Riflebacteria bacterium]|nr:hypothetical protein [Candidatus Riflebacteria bacterium]
MIQLVNKTAPYINLWLNAAERDPSADPAFIQMLQDLERTPDLTRTLLLAKEFLANSNLRLLGLTALLLGTFDDAKAQGVLDVVLKHAEPKIRVVGLEAAQLGGTTWGLKRCLSGLADKDQMVRVRAQELCKLWDKERIRVLFDELLQRGDTTSMTEAAEGLSRLADVTFLPLIERAMAQVDLTLKRKLVRGLIRIASPEMLDWTKGLK